MRITKDVLLMVPELAWNPDIERTCLKMVLTDADEFDDVDCSDINCQLCVFYRQNFIAAMEQLNKER